MSRWKKSTQSDRLALSEVLESASLLAVLQVFSPGQKKRTLRRYSETAAAAMVELDEPRPGLYLVEAAGGAELAEILAVVAGLCLATDGRGFPLERAHYVFAIVQLLPGQTLESEQTGPDEPPAREGEEKHGHPTDQTG